MTQPTTPATMVTPSTAVKHEDDSGGPEDCNEEVPSNTGISTSKLVRVLGCLWVGVLLVALGMLAPFK